MDGEEGSSERRSTRIMASKATVTASEVCVLKAWQTEKRKSKEEETAAGDDSAPKICTKGEETAPRRKEAGIGSSELKHGAAPVKGEGAPGKRMTRLTQEEINSILETVMDDDHLPPGYKALKRHNPDLIPSPEEAADEELVSFYHVVRQFHAVGDEFREFQARIRSEYAKNGYVEVDDEFLANRAEGQAIIEEARKEAFKDFDFSDLMD